MDSPISKEIVKQFFQYKISFYDLLHDDLTEEQRRIIHKRAIKEPIEVLQYKLYFSNTNKDQLKEDLKNLQNLLFFEMEELGRSDLDDDAHKKCFFVWRVVQTMLKYWFFDN